jgi:hypothetical protein
MENNSRTGSITGALTGLFFSIIHVIPFTSTIESLDILWFAISFIIGGVGGTFGEWVAKYLKKKSMINFSIIFGFLGGGLAYVIQFTVMGLYSIAYPAFVP